jgi:predicted phosphodiesterase
VPNLILSDIHANLEALEAVLADAEGKYDQILCLGDLVGYGADPNAIVGWARANVAAIIRGNHDKDCSNNDSLEHYRSVAVAAALWTRSHLSEESLAYLRAMPRGPLRYDGVDLVHGSPGDEDEYVTAPEEAAQLRQSLDTQVTFFGHTHIQGGFLLARRGVKEMERPEVLELEPDHSYLLNPGSVGQPRDGDPRAGYILYDSERRIVEYRRVGYDVAKAASKIRQAGLPDALAERLFLGI